MMVLKLYLLWFSPVFAAIHPRSKFVHLRRNPEDVFESFFTKLQWNEGQLRPLDYAFSPEFRWKRPVDNLPSCIAWYLRLTEVFARAMGRVVGPERFIEVSSDKLFAQDREEIGRLLDFTEAGISVDDAVDHFGKKINSKDHKISVKENEMAEPRALFSAAMKENLNVSALDPES